jgi:formate dehydrogenase alpha subunit
MTNSISGIEGMEVIFIIGSNTKETHPVIANWMIKAYRKGAKIIVADPRKVPMVRFADTFLRLKPGTDVALLNGIAHVIIKEKLHDKEFIGEQTEGFNDWVKTLKEYTPAKVEKITGIPKEDIIKASRLFGSSKKAGIFYTMGITQHTCGADNVGAIANLAMLTGILGKPHVGVNPLRGQNNVQGACDSGALPNVYPGYQPVEMPQVKAKFEKAWDTELPGTKGLTSTEMIPAALKGSVKALYVMGENPVLSDPNMNHTVKSLKSLDFLVVQDIFMTETAELADVVLPAACFAEKDGTFTNTERKVQRIRKAVSPPGEAMEDSWILAELSTRMGYPMEHEGAEEIFNEIGSLWPALAGITYRRIAKNGLQWPCLTENHPGTEYLYRGGFPRGKGQFTPVGHKPPAEVADKNYPLVLTTGRNLFQYHTGSMTRKVKAVEAHAGKPYVEISPADAKKLGVKDGEKVMVTSRRGKVTIKARIGDVVPKGTVFLPMHYSEAAANVLTNDALDPKAKTPEFKVCAVKIRKLS